ncbi:glycosyltransferase family 2 protein [Shimia sp. Alg240-R146]|uniref:glycosyltransferase family 2 protein n=1 Tax=Shimia sp. Alg240-R146 TaxID=2993449 RepID=UPI0022E3F52C|nr:glycosyltransferase family A protein [Shimia sp. Alg240-R146]
MLTVCIPAYRASDFIAETVKSVLSQTFTDFNVKIAIDPPDDDSPDGTYEALEPFLSDPRIRVSTNSVRLGWAENIDALIKSVETEFYVILPHDDLWLPNYLETLFPLVCENAEASVAYADLTMLATPHLPKREVVLPRNESRGLHLLRFHLQNAHAMPWRGVTRRSTIATTGGFPSDNYLGFAVECEYALGLLHAGRAIHVPETLYQKRLFRNGRVSASKERRKLQSVERRFQAWERHKDEMLKRSEQMIVDQDLEHDIALLCRSAAYGAMVSRRFSMVRRGLLSGEPEILQNVIKECGRLAHPMAPDVVEKLQLLIAK